MTAPRTIVVGGGLIGLSIARALTERGVGDVLVLERHVLASGGTGKSSGIVRAHYGVPSIATMAWRSLPVFEELGDARPEVAAHPSNQHSLTLHIPSSRYPSGSRRADLFLSRSRGRPA